MDDKTFGLKNKNKSKRVQGFINSVQKSVHNSGDPRQRKLDENRKRQKSDMKAKKKAADDEKKALFNDALMAVQKKKTTDKKTGQVKAQGRDGGEEDKKKSGTSRAMKMMFQMDAQEMEDKLKEDPNYVPTLEDEIESQRQKKVQELKKLGIKGTPVTPETFKIWQDKKIKKRQLEARKKVEQELKKKKGGKGLGVLSGRDLYEYKRDLFKDDNLDGEDVEIDYTDDNAVDDDPASLASVSEVVEKVQTDLFLDGHDDDLDDLDEEE